MNLLLGLIMLVAESFGIFLAAAGSKLAFAKRPQNSLRSKSQTCLKQAMNFLLLQTLAGADVIVINKLLAAGFGGSI